MCVYIHSPSVCAVLWLKWWKSACFKIILDHIVSLKESCAVCLAARCLYIARHKAILDSPFFVTGSSHISFMSSWQSCPISVGNEIMNIVLTQKSWNPRMPSCSPDPSAFVVALANCSLEEIKGTPVGCGLFLCWSATVGDGGLKEKRVNRDCTGSYSAAYIIHEPLIWS